MLVGLTGGIGSGKSTVATRLRELGAAVVDADVIAREIVAPGQPGLDELVDRFGEDILQPDGTLDRPGLAAIVFSDDEARADLNAITHPRIAERLLERVGQLEQDPPDDRVIVLDVPLLTESSELAQDLDALIVVEAPEETRIDRVLTSRDTTEQDVRARIAAQQTDERRRHAATHVIDNSGSLEELYGQVDRLYAELVAAAGAGDDG